MVGHIRSVDDGRVLRAGTERPVKTVVFDVVVSEVLAGRGDAVKDGHLWFEVPRPTRGVAVEQYAESLPNDEVVLFLFDRTNLSGVENSNAGRPAGTKVFAPLPQGFWLGTDVFADSVWVEDLMELPEGWAGIDTIPELVASLGA